MVLLITASLCAYTYVHRKRFFLVLVFYLKPFVILWVPDWGSQYFIKWLKNIWMISNKNIIIKTNLFPFPYDFPLQGLPFFKQSPWIQCSMYNQSWTCYSLPYGKIKVNFCSYQMVIFSKPLQHLLLRSI